MSHWSERVSPPWLRESLLLMRVDRPIGTWLLMWPALWGLVAAEQGHPSWHLLLIFALGSFVMRSAGCVANDITDRDIDPLVTRTQNRPLAAGRISLVAAKRLLLGLLTIALFLGLLLPVMAIQLSFAGAVLAMTYPFAKRFIPIPQFHLGVAFGWGVPIAWAAAKDSVPLEAWLLFSAALLWTVGFDTIYAMMDRNDDLKIGVQSTALFFGQYDIAATAMMYIMSIGLLAVTGFRIHMNIPFYFMLIATLGHAFWQIYSIRHRDPVALLHAFLSNKWFGAMVFLGFLLGG
ncbi:MAG: 4-hydroxybenzoate octaprenyltransferase [Magnetococcus sp. YQC-5]